MGRVGKNKHYTINKEEEEEEEEEKRSIIGFGFQFQARDENCRRETSE